MKDTWGRRVWGEVRKGPTHTRFRLEIKLQNECIFYQVIRIPNNELELYPKLYGFTLDRMTEKLDERVKSHHEEWMR